MHSGHRKRVLAMNRAGMQTLSVVVVIILFILGFFSLKYQFPVQFASFKTKYRVMKNFLEFLVNSQIFSLDDFICYEVGWHSN